MKTSTLFRGYLAISFCIFISLISIPIFAQNSSEEAAETTETPPLILSICEESAEATEETLGYLVQEGDTLETIAETLQVNLDVLAALNDLEADAELEPGQELLIPTIAEATEEAACISPEDNSIWYINTSGGANALIRSCPDRSCDVVLRLPFASSISVILTEDDWHTILLDDGTVAYVAVSVTSSYMPQLPSVVASEELSTPNETPDPSNPTGSTSGASTNEGGSTSGSTSGGGNGGGGVTPTPTRGGDPND